MIYVTKSKGPGIEPERILCQEYILQFESGHLILHIVFSHEAVIYIMLYQNSKSLVLIVTVYNLLKQML